MIMTGAKLFEIRVAYLALSRAQLAEAMGVNKSTILRWENGARPIPAWVPKFLELLHGKNR